MSVTNLQLHVKDSHKRLLREVMEEQGRKYVYSGKRTRVGISGIEVMNVGPSNPRKEKVLRKDNL